MAQPPVAVARKVVSLQRADATWDIRTTIWLTAEGDPLNNLAFVITSPPSKGTLSCNKACASGHCTQVEPNPPDPSPSRSCRCEYQPTPGASGADSFSYIGKANGLDSAPAKVEIDIRSRGLRWELVTQGTTGLTSDVNPITDIASVIGKNAMDFQFILNWVTDFPEQRVSEGRLNELTASGATPAQPLTVSRSGLAGGPTKNLNVVFRTGLVTSPLSVQATDRGEPTQGEQVAPTGTGDTAMVASLQRVFTVGGELNFNSVFKYNGTGHFLEVGLSGKGAFDTAVETDTTQISAGRLIELLRDERGTFRYEGTVRMALKQERSADTTLRISGTRVEHAADAEEMLIIEGGIQRDNGLSNLPAGGGESQNRLVFRFLGMPPIPTVPGKPRGLIGVEVSRAIKGGSKIVKILYGVNLGRDNGV